jgi:hypothetical protein
MFGSEDRDWTEIKKQLDVHLNRLYVKGTTLAEPNTLSNELVVISSLKVNLAILSAELINAADRQKAKVYFDILARANVSRAKEECRLDGYYLDLKLKSEQVAAYLKEVSSLVSTVQTYLRWKGQEVNL